MQLRPAGDHHDRGAGPVGPEVPVQDVLRLDRVDVGQEVLGLRDRVLVEGRHERRASGEHENVTTQTLRARRPTSRATRPQSPGRPCARSRTSAGTASKPTGPSSSSAAGSRVSAESIAAGDPHRAHRAEAAQAGEVREQQAQQAEDHRHAGRDDRLEGPAVGAPHGDVLRLARRRSSSRNRETSSSE